MYLYKLSIIDLPILIRIRLIHHRLQFTGGQPLSKVGHDDRKLVSGDISIAVLIEYFESLTYLLFTVRILELTAHHLLRTKDLQYIGERKEERKSNAYSKELVEVNCSICVLVDLVDHVL